MVEKATLDRVEKLPNGRNIIRGGGFFSGLEMKEMTSQSLRRNDGKIQATFPFKAEGWTSTENQDLLYNSGAATPPRANIKPVPIKKVKEKSKEAPKVVQDELSKAKDDMKKLLERYGVKE